MSCTLKDPEIGQCCCNCAFLRAVHYHCTTEPKPPSDSKCVCGIKKGFACVPPNSNRVYDNWSQHSAGCEYYTPKD